ncbi:MAG: HlyC/CorC family transporter [Clostridiales bacterium]|nr:HlyC/CorC family transporter [Clostridiales bacterium]MBQ3321320.1 HlyC/CorC family transporter [Bacillota bacterium]
MLEDPMIPLWGVLIGLALIIINAWFSAARKSISEANKVKLRELAEDGNSRAKAAIPVMENAPVSKLSLRVLNVLIYMLYCIVCMICLGVPLYRNLNLLWESETLSIIVAFIIVLFVSLIFLMALGEMLPRRIAMQHAEGVVMTTAGSIKVLNVLLRPVTACIAVIAILFLKIFRQRADLNDNEYSEEDIVEMLEAGQESGELKEEGKKMITGVFAFDDILAYEIMTPRTDVFAIDINDEPQEYIDELMRLKYSRIPVYEDDSDNIIGVLNIKDYLIQAREQGFDNVDIRPILRNPYFVPETKNIDSLFFELQKTKQQIAILIDEYGGFCGIVTMEDIIEEVMGDIDDEYDEEEQELTKIGDDLYLIEGSMYLDDINEELGTNLESEDSETIGGLIIDMFGEIPDDDDLGKEVFLDNLVFTINSVKDRRIEKVIMKINQEEDREKD